MHLHTGRSRTALRRQDGRGPSARQSFDRPRFPQLSRPSTGSEEDRKQVVHQTEVGDANERRIRTSLITIMNFKSSSSPNCNAFYGLLGLQAILQYFCEKLVDQKIEVGAQHPFFRRPCEDSQLPQDGRLGAHPTRAESCHARVQRVSAARCCGFLVYLSKRIVLISR